MADYFDQQPNFTNPAYSTPEQLANQRAYADALMKRSGGDVTRPAGAAANVLDAITAALTRHNANQIQSQAAQGNSQDISAMISQLQGGQKMDPENLGHIAANPMASPEARALVNKLITPEATKSVYGQPGFQSPVGGVQAAPIQGAFDPGYNVEQGAEGVHSNAPMPAPTVQRAPLQAPVQGGIYGGMSKPVGWDTNNMTPQAPGNGGGGPQAGAGLPPAPPAAVAPNGAPNAPMNLDQLAAKGREFKAQSAFTQGGADAITGVQKDDIASATAAPTIKRVAGVMLNDLQTHGDQMTFGPTAAWSNDVKRAAANYAPGLMKDQLQTLASADSFDKMSAQLTSILAKGGGTDAQLFNNMKSVPGSHNSKEGAEALLKMTLQVADQQQALRQATSGVPLGQYEAARNDFYAKNPIVNPITGNPIKLDLEKERTASASSGPVSVSSPEEARKLPKGTPIRLPDGRTGVVP